MSKNFSDKYIVHEMLGKGRVSTAYRATDTETNRTVVIKIFSPQHIPGKKSLEYLESELKRRMIISHPNIVKIYDVGRYQKNSDPTTLYMVVEYVEGCTIAQRIVELNDQPFSLRQICMLMLQVIDALEHLHAQDIYITNLDPKQLLLKDDSQIKLPPFGFFTTAQWTKDISQFTRISGIDYRYVAPEIISQFGVAKGNIKSEIYLLGIFAFELGCGTAPFDANKSILMQLQKTEPIPNTLIECGLPKWFDGLVKACMEKDPAKRPSLADLKQRLLDMLIADKIELETTPRYVDHSKVNVLFVEDNKLDQLSLARFAKKERYPFSYKIAFSVEEARDMLSIANYDVIVSDYMLPDGTAIDVIKSAMGIPTIVITGSEKDSIAIQVLKAGAFDYIPKDMHFKYLRDLAHHVERAYKHGQISRQRDLFTEQVKSLLMCSLDSLQLVRNNVADMKKFEFSIRNLEETWRNFEKLVDKNLPPDDTTYHVY